MINVKNIKSKHQLLCSLIHSKKIKDALDVLKELISESSFSDFFIQLDHLESTYEQMLKYTIEGIHDPERDKIYMKLQVSILELADKVRANLLKKYSGWHTFTLQNELEKQQKITGKGIIENLDDLAFRLELDDIINEDKTSPKTNDLKRRGVIMEIFKHLWLTDVYGDAENSLVNALLTCKDFTWYEQSLQISGILLSGLRYFEEEKFHRLIDFTSHDNSQVSARAMVALVILLYRYDDRIYLFPSLKSRLDLMKDLKDIDKMIEQIVLQLIRTEDTLELGKKLQEDIIPEMVKLKPKLEDKLRMEDLQEEDSLDEKNPDWQNMFQESDELYKKMDQFMKLQMEGADVYMTTFAQLKNFPFFNELTNWLIPFYEENPDLTEIFAQKSDDFNPEPLILGLQKMPFLCNSDKYSFIFNVKFLPDDQKKMLSSAFSMEMESLSEMLSDDELLNADFARRLVFVQYIQDLYRFFKISPFKNEFEDVFSGKLEIQKQSFLNQLLDNKEVFRNIAEYYFEKEHHEEALAIFMSELETAPNEPELLEKVAYCYQQMANYKKALHFFERIDGNSKKTSWVIRNMGLCYRKIEDYESALNLYQAAVIDSPDDERLMSLVGYCNLKLESYEIALKHYFKIEYMNPGNTNVIRPIAWCYFMLADYEKSEKYYNKVFDLKPDYYDYVNFGHLKWMMGERTAAIDNYILSTNYNNYSVSDLQKTIEDDSEILIAKGINKEEISLMMDYLRYKL